jgi:hypothetical protein
VRSQASVKPALFRLVAHAVVQDNVKLPWKLMRRIKDSNGRGREPGEAADQVMTRRMRL